MNVSRRSNADRSNADRTNAARLSGDRIVEAAMKLADEGGLEAVTMRAVAATLEVEAMSLYNHVVNRAAILDAMVDRVFAGMARPDSGDWQSDLSALAREMRSALRAHPWATGLLDSRQSPGEATLQHHDHVLGVLRRAGFSSNMSVHVLALVDSYVYGSVVQEANLPLEDFGGQSGAAENLLATLPAEKYPYLAEIARSRVEMGDQAPDAQEEFEFGLNVIISALKPAD